MFTYSPCRKPPTTENRNLRTNRKPLPSKPPPKAYLNHTVQANQTCQGPPWILPVTPVSTGRVQATSKHLTASLRVECVPGTQPHKPVRPTAGRARRNPSTLGSDRAADARAIRRSRCAESQPNQPAEVADVRSRRLASTTPASKPTRRRSMPVSMPRYSASLRPEAGLTPSTCCCPRCTDGNQVADV